MYRRIYKSQSGQVREINDLLQALLVGELLNTSSKLWFVSAWISNIQIVDNRAGEFSHLNRNMPARQIFLAEMIGYLLENGAQIIIATNQHDHNDSFMQSMHSLKQSMPDAKLSLLRRKTLHRKGILGKNFFLSGSMNLTYNGIFVTDEDIILENDPEKVSEGHIAFSSEYED